MPSSFPPDLPIELEILNRAQELLEAPILRNSSVTAAQIDIFEWLLLSQRLGQRVHCKIGGHIYDVCDCFGGDVSSLRALPYRDLDSGSVVAVAAYRAQDGTLVEARRFPEGAHGIAQCRRQRLNLWLPGVCIDAVTARAAQRRQSMNRELLDACLEAGFALEPCPNDLDAMLYIAIRCEAVRYPREALQHGNGIPRNATTWELLRLRIAEDMAIMAHESEWQQAYKRCGQHTLLDHPGNNMSRKRCAPGSDPGISRGGAESCVARGRKNAVAILGIKRQRVAGMRVQQQVLMSREGFVRKLAAARPDVPQSPHGSFWRSLSGGVLAASGVLPALSSQGGGGHEAAGGEEDDWDDEEGDDDTDADVILIEPEEDDQGRPEEAADFEEGAAEGDDEEQEDEDYYHSGNAVGLYVR